MKNYPCKTVRVEVSSDSIDVLVWRGKNRRNWSLAKPMRHYINISNASSERLRKLALSNKFGHSYKFEGDMIVGLMHRYE